MGDTRVPGTKKLERILEDRIDKDISEKTLIGASCAVLSKKGRICTVTKGVSDPNTMAPLGESHIFRLASMTKLLTVAGLLLQIESGKISFDTEISKFFPGFGEKWIARADKDSGLVFDKKSSVPITIRHLVTHTSGLGSGPAGDYQRGQLTGEQKATVASIVEFYENEAVLDFEPGRAWGYSALAAFDVMARIIELCSDMGFDRYMKKYIFDPLEADDMTFLPSEEQWGRIVAMHDKTPEGKAIAADWGKTVLPGLPATNFCGGGGLVSTLEDYCRFVLMLMSGGVYKGCRILSEQSVESMGSQMLPEPYPGLSSGISWGAGCMIYKNFPPLPAGCFGWSGAWGTHMWIDPVNNIGAVYMRNSAFAEGAGAATARNFEKDVYAAVTDVK